MRLITVSCLVAVLSTACSTSAPTTPSHLTTPMNRLTNPIEATVVLRDLSLPVTLHPNDTLGIFRQSPNAMPDGPDALELVADNAKGWIWRAVNTGSFTLRIGTATEDQFHVVDISVTITR